MGGARTARITVKTLAAAVGVSPSTISNAYNRPDQLSPELRQRILTTATDLGYAGPDAAGRALRVGRTGAVGVLLTERLSYAFSDPYAVEFLTGVTEAVEQQNISVLLMPLAWSDGEADVTALRQANIDALAIMCLRDNHPAGILARARGLRLVTTDPEDDPDSSWVTIDDADAGRLIGAHLAGLGHRRVAAIADTNAPAGSPTRVLPHGSLAAADWAVRLDGLRNALPEDLLVVTGGHNALGSGVSATHWLLDQPDPPTAIVGLTDVLALGALEALSARGLRVPQDVSVCGFDDIPAAAGHNLTTVRQPIRLRGQEVGRLLTDPLSLPRQVVLPIELIPRGTSGPVRAR
ncbi:MAG: LacI family transcriptional regulator [Friedmanniella sp.]|nr:LacI family transcriptional regulator [Friedmanniella sp.]